MLTKRPSILHLSFDYAESYSENNIGKSTTVIADFIKSVSEFSENYVISLARNPNPFHQEIREIKRNHLHIISWGLPYSILIKYSMNLIFKKILRLPQNISLKLDKINIIHAHKLTFEGFVGYFISKYLNKKLIISIRQTDFSVLKIRKDLLPFVRQILKYSSKIFIIAPYMKIHLKQILGSDFFLNFVEPKLVYMPNVVELSRFIFSPSEKQGNLLTISWLDKKAVKRKNLYSLFKAMSQIDNKMICLDLIGSGNYERKVRKWATKLGLSGRVNFLGFIPNERIGEYIRRSKALLLPSLSETFGVVYVEALACGTPILYSKNTGFDGLFDGVGVAVNPKSVDDIKQGIITILKNNDFFRKNITKLNEQNALHIFSKEHIKNIYLSSIESLI